MFVCIWSFQISERKSHTYKRTYNYEKIQYFPPHFLCAIKIFLFAFYSRHKYTYKYTHTHKPTYAHIHSNKRFFLSMLPWLPHKSYTYVSVIQNVFSPWNFVKHFFLLKIRNFIY